MSNAVGDDDAVRIDHGKALAIVQSTERPGPITVSVTSPGLRPAATTIFAGHGGQARRTLSSGRAHAAKPRQSAHPTADASFSGRPDALPAAMLDGVTTSGGWSNFYNKDGVQRGHHDQLRSRQLSERAAEADQPAPQ